MPITPKKNILAFAQNTLSLSNNNWQTQIDGLNPFSKYIFPLFNHLIITLMYVPKNISTAPKPTPTWRIINNIYDGVVICTIQTLLIALALGGGLLLPKEAAGQDCTPLSQCQMILDPDFNLATNCPGEIDPYDGLLGARALTPLCMTEPSCWQGVFEINQSSTLIDYGALWVDSAPTPTGDGEQIKLATHSSTAYPDVQCCEFLTGLATPVSVQAGQTYLLSYMARASLPNTLTPTMPFPDAQSGCTLPTFPGAYTTLDHLWFCLANSTELLTLGNWGQPEAAEPTQLVPLVDETSLVGNNWWRIVRSINIPPGLGANFDRLLIYPEVDVCQGTAYAYLDQVEMGLDDFPTTPQIFFPCVGDNITIGPDICHQMSDMRFTWSIQTPTGWQAIPAWNDLTQVGLTISNNEAQTYQICRDFVGSGGYFLLDYTSTLCMTIHIFPETAGTPLCCLNNLQTTDPNYFYHVGIDYNYTASGSNITWSPGSHPLNNTGNAASPIRMNGDLIVPSGVNLTLQDLYFEFGSLGKIIVQPNATLRIDNCSLQGLPSCQTMWQGIRVVGPGMATARIETIPRNYGALDLLNNTTIADALIGVACMNTPTIPLDEVAINFAPVFESDLTYTAALWADIYTQGLTTGGGVCRSGIEAPNNPVHFLNCYQGMNLSFYDNNWQTRVRETIFDCNRVLWYPFSELPIAGRTISEMGINANFYTDFETVGTEFINQTFGIRGFGLESIYISTCTFSQPNFNLNDPNDNLHQTVGISVWNMNASPLLPIGVGIKNNTFRDIDIAMQLAYANTNIMLNNINTENDPKGFIGALLLGCDYTVQDNHIENMVAGVAMQNNTLPSVVRKNEFKNTEIATWEIGNNDNSQIKCNSFDGYILAMFVDNNIVTVDGNLPNQGDCLDVLDPDPADNTFINQSEDWFGNNQPDIVSNISDPFIYYYRNEPTYIPTANISTIPQVCESLNQTAAQNCAEYPIIDSDIYINIDERVKDRTIRERIRYYIEVAHDTTAAVNLLTTVDNGYCRRLAADYYIAKGLYTQAQQSIDGLATDTPAKLYFAQLAQIRLNMAQQQRPIWGITPAEEAALHTIAQSRTDVAYQAQAILYLVRGTPFPIQLPDLPTYLPPREQAFMVHFKTQSELSGSAISVFPNPSNGDWLYIKDKAAQLSQASFVLYDPSGRVVLQQQLTQSAEQSLQLPKLANGLYYYAIIQANGEVIARQKISIIH